MIDNYSWNLLSYLSPFMVVFIVITTLLIEGRFLNSRLKNFNLVIPLIILGNLGSFIIGLPISNNQHFLGFPLFNTFFSLYYDILRAISGIFHFKIEFFSGFILILLIYFGLIVVSTILETILIKLVLRKSHNFHLGMGFQMNFYSHMFIFGVFILLGIANTLISFPLDLFFTQIETFSDANTTFLFFFP